MRTLEVLTNLDPYITENKTEIATFAAGCFWGVENIFQKHFPPEKGILKTTVGYTGGKEEATNPDYPTVRTGVTDHAEAVRIEFDPNVVKYEELVGECQLRYVHPNPRVPEIAFLRCQCRKLYTHSTSPQRSANYVTFATIVASPIVH